MNKTSVRCPLESVQMPFLYRDAARSVMLPNLDSKRVEPQLLYCENVMPLASGLASTALNDLIAASGSGFDQAVVLRDKNENNTLLVPADGSNYLLDVAAGTWKQSLPFLFTNKLVTRGYTQGRSFIFYEKEKLFEYDGANNELVEATLVLPSGLSISSVRGIGSASNYLLLFTDIEILWSSPNDPLNFDWNTNNGSGRQTPQDVRGQISCILGVAGGAIIYTLRNAVAITYTNNAATPFIFRGIPNSGGVASYEQVAFDADEQAHFVWGSGGMQQVSLQSAEPVFPELSDFLTNGRYEYYDATTHTVREQIIGTSLEVKLTYVSQRYLVVSYGPSGYTYALIYDLALKRWGKVRVDHVDAFTYPYPNITGDLSYGQLNTDYGSLGDTTYAELGVGIVSISPPKRSLAFMGPNGAISVLSIDYNIRVQKGVLVLGQFQFNRDNMTTLHEVELEGMASGKLYAQVSLNGKTVDRTVEYDTFGMEDEYRNYYGRETGRNISVAVEGVFQLTGLLTKVAKSGRY